MGNGQIAQQLKASSLLSEDHGWVPSAQPSVTSVSGNQMLSSDVCGHCIIWYTGRCIIKPLIHRKQK